ncbi:hypothetical protein BBR47_35590 [Brevibacillus brevis NBRC 100599]|uniref:Uncharacterized protein n=1 Tax=Brevibacillus brevis (strain 47 / JCM 6285 / NBRC 100599) TaxID=358681 RepID=C0ZFH7_BREBN|nr:hypothetical protein [Brevibacillus brevis]BAH44536.1 hypothetical protein BBR47_35590 [Brevibacillus brevis NBRC 100599]
MTYNVRPYQYRATAKFENGEVSIHEDNSVETLDTSEFADTLLGQGRDWSNEVVPVLKQIDTMVREHSMEMWKKELSLRSAAL